MTSLERSSAAGEQVVHPELAELREAVVSPKISDCILKLRTTIEQGFVGSREKQQEINESLREAYQAGVQPLGRVLPSKKYSRRSQQYRTLSWGHLRPETGKVLPSKIARDDIPDVLRELADLRSQVLTIARAEMREKRQRAPQKAKASDRQVPARASDRVALRTSGRHKKRNS